MSYTELFNVVKEHMGWDNKKTELWFESPNPNFGGTTPNFFYMVRPEKCEKLILSMISESK